MIVLSFVLVIVAAVTLVIGLFQTDSGLGWIWASIGSCVAAMVFLGIGVVQRRGVVARPRVEPDEAYRRAPLPDLPYGAGSTMTRPESAGVAPEELAIVTGRTNREPSQRILEAEGILEAEPSHDSASEPPLVPKRTAETTTSRTGSARPTESRTAEVPLEPTRGSAAAVEDAAAGASPSPSPAASPPRPAQKKTAARAGEPTTAKKTTAKATKKATSRQTAAAPTASREAARRTTGKKATGQRPAAQSARPEAAKSSRRSGRQTTGEAARAELAKIKGLGPAKQEALLREFGSVEAIRAATVEQLTSIRGIGETTAREILAQARR
ncbi:MAG: helix-hairpin-helix domain-containing protein [Actinomycetota bacterium]|nr:helix-hairpin-helix domain-containing protein [Actinomycetota bacterium]